MVVAIASTLLPEAAVAQRPDDSTPAAVIAVQGVRSTVAGLHVWNAGHRLLIGTINDGLYVWRADRAAPDLTPLPIGRTLEFREVGSDVLIGTESGLFRWRSGASAPEQVPGVTKGAYEFAEWNGGVLVRSEGMFWLGPGAAVATALTPEEHYVWHFATWNGSLVYGNLNGIHVIDAPGTAARHELTDSEGIEGLFPCDSKLVVLTRGRGTFVLRPGSPPESVEPPERIDRFVRGTIRWNGHNLVGTDSGVWDLDGCSALRQVGTVEGQVWGGMLELGGELFIGTTRGLFRWRVSADVPERVPDIDRVEALLDWNGTLAINTLADGGATDLAFLRPGDTRVQPFGMRVGEAREMASWRGGLAIGQNGGLAYIGPETFSTGRVEIAPIAHYDIEQPMYVSWRVLDTPLSAFALDQAVEVRRGAELINRVVVRDRDRRSPTEFALVLPAISATGDYEVSVEVRLPIARIVRQRRGVRIGPRITSAPFDLRATMGWQRPRDLGSLLKTLSINVGVLGAVYYLVVAALYLFRPGLLVSLHEAIRTGRLPGGNLIATLAVPFLIRTDRCLDAFVRKHIDKARCAFEETPDVQVRPTWVPSPLRVGAALIADFHAPETAHDRNYVPGLSEIAAAAPGGRLFISIEGPGGFGKSALAFQIARWAADVHARSRLRPHPMLPILIDDPCESVDKAIRARLEFATDKAAISDALFEALLRKARILAVVDGVSEKPAAVRRVAIQPDKGAVHCHALVVTGRLSTQLPNALLLVPQGLNLSFLDSFLDDLVIRTLGAGRFSPRQREAIRSRLISVMRDLQRDDDARAIPMLMVALMLRRADELARTDADDLSSLPDTFFGLVEAYVDVVLRHNEETFEVIGRARKAAVACLGEHCVPAFRPLAAFQARSLSLPDLRTFVAAGLMVESGTTGDPTFKFALDPVAETLAALDWALRLRDGAITGADLPRLDAESTAEGSSEFRAALARAVFDKTGRRLEEFAVEAAPSIHVDTALLSELRGVLCSLYIEPRRARIVASDAGLDLKEIDLSGTPTEFWDAVIKQALRSRRLDALIGMVSKEYDRPEFRSLAEKLKTA